jgi:hypothetical protein
VTVAVGAAGVAAGFGVAAAAAGFLAISGGFALGFAAGLLAAGGVSAPGGVNDICAAAPAVNNRQVARIDMGRRIFISGAIPVRLWLFRALRRTLA